MAIDIDNGLPNPENRTTQQHFTYWIRVEAAIGDGQQVSYNGRSLTRADEAWVTKRRMEYENKLASEAAKSSGLSSGPVYLG